MSTGINPFSSMHWGIGVVENTNDPLMVNRVQARFIGYHTVDRSLLPTEKLPWCTFMQSPSNMSAPMVVPGSWVICIFLDGASAQQPVILGLLDGIPIKQDPSVGFTDPSGVYPRVYDKPTTSPLARGDLSASNPITYSKGQVTYGVPEASGGTWSEPPSAYAAVYPQNHVIQTDKNNIIELDDTTGAERVHIFHRSGSLIEIHPDGSVVRRSVGSDYEIVASDKNVYINGTCNITAAGNLNLLSGGDVTIGGKNITLTASDSIKVTSGDGIDISAKGSVNVQGSEISQKASGLLALDGSSIAIESGESSSAASANAPPGVSAAGLSKYDA